MRTESKNKQTAWSAGKRKWPCGDFRFESDWSEIGAIFLDQSRNEEKQNQSNSGIFAIENCSRLSFLILPNQLRATTSCVSTVFLWQTQTKDYVFEESPKIEREEKIFVICFSLVFTIFCGVILNKVVPTADKKFYLN